MRILYIHQYYVNPSMAGGTRSYEFARRFVKAGHDVHVFTSDQSGAGRGWRSTLEQGVTVHWLPVHYSNNMGYLARVRAFLEFALTAGSKAREVGGDVIFASSTPLTIAVPALWAARRLGIPLVFEVRDLWPEAPRQLGALSNPILLWLARRLEKKAYRDSAHVVALSPGMRDGIVNVGTPPDRVTVIPNSCDLELFRPDVDGASVRRSWGQDNLVLVYFGTMGVANGLDLVLDAAKELLKRGNLTAKFILHGEGSQKARLTNRISTEGLENVLIEGPSPKSAMPAIAAAADVCMTIFADVPILRTNSPNKMFDSFAAGKPVLTNMPGWLSELVERNKCGVSVAPADSCDFADKVEWLIAHREELPEMGTRARVLAESEFSRDVLAARLLGILEDAAADRH